MGRMTYGFPVKEAFTFVPFMKKHYGKFLPELLETAFLEKVPQDLMVGKLPDYLKLEGEAREAFVHKMEQANASCVAELLEEVADFGVEIDLDAPCHIWSNTDPEVQEACVAEIEEKYAGRTGEIIFYGPSNIQMWYSLEEDMLPYKAQNHGMGGCIDPEMMTYAPRMLYAFKPSVVFFQTGSNDLANGLSLETILENKKKMYGEYLENMPDTKLVVMAGLPLPSRQQFWADTIKTNALLKEMCEHTDRMYFMDATEGLLMDEGPENMQTNTGDNRYFNPSLYRPDGIHLNKKGHDVWTAYMKEMLSRIL